MITSCTHPHDRPHDRPIAPFRVADRLRQIAEVMHRAALILVLCASPSSYTTSCRREAARQICLAALRPLVAFTLLWTLVSLVLIRIVMVTAQSYGLSAFALEMVIRVLIVELIPLFAALAIGLRPSADPTAATHATAWLGNAWRESVVARSVAAATAVMALATISGAITLLTAYLNAFGFSLWGLGDFTRSVGQVFNLATTLGFLGKTVLFSLTVGMLPPALALARRADTEATSRRVSDLAAMLLLLVLIETIALSAQYV
jgi:phospholipid/cholesterol/gamma-HCH transport system permease protein